MNEHVVTEYLIAACHWIGQTLVYNEVPTCDIKDLLNASTMVTILVKDAQVARIRAPHLVYKPG